MESITWNTWGLVTIRASASFSGELYGGHLVVEDGAIFEAKVCVGEEGLKQAEELKSRLALLPAGEGDPEKIVVPPLPDAAAEPAA